MEANVKFPLMELTFSFMSHHLLVQIGFPTSLKLQDCAMKLGFVFKLGGLCGLRDLINVVVGRIFKLHEKNYIIH